jgi:N-acetylneuraminate synthase/sialic acid synthase
MSDELFIEKRHIADCTPCFVVAEIGHNHMGDVEICKQLFAAAKYCGCDAVKLQKRNNKMLYTKSFYNKPYHSEHAYGATYGEHREALEFDYERYTELKKYAKELGIIFFATAFDYDSADFLEALDMPCFKIASGDLTNTPFIEYVASYGKPMIISTGGSYMTDVHRAYKTMKDTGTPFALLHCIASYPNKPEEINLNLIRKYKELMPDIVIGWSDHYNGIVMAEAAYVMGARIVEKHFTLDHTWKGSDHALSLQPEGMRRLCRDLKRLHVAMGDGMKRFWLSEKDPVHKMGKGVYLSRNVPVNYQLAENDLVIKSPAAPIKPYDINEVIGKVTLCNLTTADDLTWEKLK